MKTNLLLFLITVLLNGDVLGQVADVKVDFSKDLGPMKMEQMALGQGGLSEEPMLASRTVEIRSLNPAIIRLFVSEYYDVIPEPGQYHFATLDSMVTNILATGAKPFMSFCLKPKLFFPVIDQDIVEPNDYKAWEEFVYQVVKHFIDRKAGIQYWEVGNEVDIGEDGGTPYRFKPESYARYYKHTTAAILRADPKAKVGGPALAYYKSPILPELLKVCAAEKIQLDFVSFHHYNNSPTVIRAQIEYVKDLVRQHPSLHPEIIMNEWNMDLFNPPLDPRFQPCYIAETIWQMKDAGLDWSCYYQIRDWYVNYDTFAKVFSPHGAAFMTRWWNRQAQFSGLIDYQNQLRPAYYSFKLLSRMAGNKLEVNSSHDKVHGFATYDPKLLMHNMMLWNFSDQAVEVELSLKDLPKEMRVRHIVLDASGAGLEENQRLRPEPFVKFKKENQVLSLKLDILYAVASDPEIWQQHPNKDRWKKEVFRTFFDGALQSKGAFKVVDKTTGMTIGSTRFYDYSSEDNSIFIGYTFYATSYWGQGINYSVKALMLDYIFQFVVKVNFHIGANNIRSQIAISRLHAFKIGQQEVTYYGEAPKLNFVYEITKDLWHQKSIPPFS